MSDRSSEPAQQPSNKQTMLFMVILSFVCALVLALLATVLAKPQETARELYRSKQMLVAARILNPSEGYLQIEENGEYKPAKVLANGRLVPSSKKELRSLTRSANKSAN